MNKKRFNIILFPAVVIIWALIIIKIFSYAKNNNSEKATDITQMYSKDSFPTSDTIKLFANYRDPFKPSSIQKMNKLLYIKPRIQPIQSKIAKEVVWPNIAFYGLVKNKSDGKELALITISNHPIVTGKNIEIEGIKAIDISPDSIKVQFQKETKIIIKK